MPSTTRPLDIATTAAFLAAATACGGAVASDPFDSGVPSTDGPAAVATGSTAIADEPPPSDPRTPARIDAGSADASVSLLPPLPCEQRAVPARCSKGDPPYYAAADLEVAWTGCGGTSGVEDRCGVLSVTFDASGCASIAFSGMPPDAGAVACLAAQLGAYRFECSAGSGITLNHLCD
jgi:hypothetical protein